MSNLDKLINELCPDGVEYKPLKKIAEIGTGTSNRIDADENGIYPFFVRSKTVIKSNKFLFDEKAIIIPGEGGVGDIFHYINGKYDLHQRAYRIYIIDMNTSTKFIYYHLAANFKKYIMMKAVNATVTSIRKPMIEDFPIPLPPLAVQEEIVKILDKFTKLTAELTAELTARQKQYEYYRDELLEFGDDVPMVNLGEIGTITRGNGLKKADFTDSGFPCIHYGQIYTYYGLFATTTKSFVSHELANSLKKVSTGDIIIAVTSENLEDVCKCVVWLGDKDIVTGGHTAILKHNQNPKFIAYWLQTEVFFAQKRKLAHGTKVIEVTPRKLVNISIPLPPLSEQARIVAILDRFDTLTNDISEGLPAEIDARRKQYEYYRNKLLTFKEKK